MLETGTEALSLSLSHTHTHTQSVGIVKYESTLHWQILVYFERCAGGSGMSPSNPQNTYLLAVYETSYPRVPVLVFPVFTVTDSPISS
jgi:hypothetical protein